MFINEAGIWQLSQHSNKTNVEKILGQHVQKNLSECYNMVFDVHPDEMFAVSTNNLIWIFFQQIKLEQGNTKYINDAGILEYISRTNGPKDAIDNIIKELGLTRQQNVNTNVVIYQDTIAFSEEDIHIEDTFCMLNIFGKIWIEAAKLCRFFITPIHGKQYASILQMKINLPLVI